MGAGAGEIMWQKVTVGKAQRGHRLHTLTLLVCKLDNVDGKVFKHNIFKYAPNSKCSTWERCPLPHKPTLLKYSFPSLLKSRQVPHLSQNTAAPRVNTKALSFIQIKASPSSGWEMHQTVGGQDPFSGSRSSALTCAAVSALLGFYREVRKTHKSDP